MPAKRPIARGVATDRKLTNAKTGIDLSVPEFKIEVQNSKYRTASRVTYSLIVVTNVPDIVTSVKNTATGKLFDKGSVIHFAQSRTYDEFWRLRRDLDKKFSGTLVPEIPKRTSKGDSIVSSRSSTRAEARNRQTSVDNLLKWCASVPKIASSEIVLKFLGWKPDRQSDDSAGADSDGDDEITKATVRTVFKRMDDIEVENEMFGNDVDDGTESDLFGQPDDVPDRESFTIRTQDAGGKESIASDRSTAKLFEALDDITLDDAKVDAGVAEFSLPAEEEPEYNEELLDDVDDTLEDVQTQIEKVSFARPSRKNTKSQTKRDHTSMKTPELNVNEMADEDLISYISKQESDDDVDLGF